MNLRSSLLLTIAVLTGCLDNASDSIEDCPRAQSVRAQDSSEGSCVGSATSCGSISAINCVQDGCTVDIGFFDDPHDDRCEGYPKDCDELDSPTSCGYQMGCSWKDSSGGTPDPTTGGGPTPCPPGSGGAGGGPEEPPGGPSGGSSSGGSGSGGAFNPNGSGGSTSGGDGGGSNVGGNGSVGPGGFEVGGSGVGGSDVGSSGVGGSSPPPPPPWR